MSPSKGSCDRARVAVVVLGEIGERMAGPSIRGWEMALALAVSCDVTVLGQVPKPKLRAGVAIEPYSRAALHRLLGVQDAVICPWFPPLVYLTRPNTGTALIADLYDPAEVEVGLGDVSGAAVRRIQEVRELTELQMRYADIIMCGADRQLELIQARMPRRADGESPTTLVVPLGMPPPPPRANSHPIRERFPQIGVEDEIILWWGTPWRWLDGETALTAFAELLKTRPRTHLVFTGARALGAPEQRYNDAGRLRQRASELGLLDRHVFFVDEWIVYDHRHEYLQEADIGLTLHRDETEGRLAMRARSRDYAWARLPCVLGRDDQLAERLAATGLATLVQTGDRSATCRALVATLDRGLTPETDRNLNDFGRRRSWEPLVLPLLEAISTAPRIRGLRRDLSIARRVPEYYARRLVHYPSQTSLLHSKVSRSR